jgi:hypothetical protein
MKLQIPNSNIQITIWSLLFGASLVLGAFQPSRFRKPSSCSFNAFGKWPPNLA